MKTNPNRCESRHSMARIFPDSMWLGLDRASLKIRSVYNHNGIAVFLIGCIERKHGMGSGSNHFDGKYLFRSSHVKPCQLLIGTKSDINVFLFNVECLG